MAIQLSSYKYRIPIESRRFTWPIKNSKENKGLVEKLCKDSKRNLYIDPNTKTIWTLKGGCPMTIVAREGDYLVMKEGGIQSYETIEEFLKEYKEVRLFGKSERSSFKYWFAHWCAFQLVALDLRTWKWKYLLHDIEKPWMKLWYRGNYKKVQTRHREHSRHHLEYGLSKGWDKFDPWACVIDWECCAYTKIQAQLDARETLEYEVSKEKWKPYEKEIRGLIEPVLNELGL